MKPGTRNYWNIIFLIACIAVLFLLFRQRLPFGRNNTDFAVKETVGISRVVFYEKGKKLVLLKNKEGEWEIENDGQARDNAVGSLLRILKEMKIKSPVTSEAFLREVTGKEIEPVKVHVYDGRRLRKSFFVYHVESNIYGNIMRISALSKPYVLFVPGYETEIGTYFTADRLFWRPFIVFDYLPSEVELVDFENCSDTASSFRISAYNGRFTLKKFNDGRLDGWDSLKVRRYVSWFTYVPFERWATELTEKNWEEIESSEPLYRITVKRKNTEPVVLTIWNKDKTSEGGVLTRDPDRVWAKTNKDEEIFVMRYFDIDPVLKKISYFMKD